MCLQWQTQHNMTHNPQHSTAQHTVAQHNTASHSINTPQHIPRHVLTAGLTPEGQQAPPMADSRCGTHEAPFEAVLVFTDPVDWYRDLQLLTDVIMSGGPHCINYQNV